MKGMNTILAAFVGGTMLACTAVASETQVLPLSGMGEAGEAPIYWDFRLDNGRGSGKWTRIAVP